MHGYKNSWHTPIFCTCFDLHVQIIDMARRFLVLGLPKLLRAIAPNAGISLYLGLLVMSLSPTLYAYMAPYEDPRDQQLMLLTQLAQTLVVRTFLSLYGFDGGWLNIPWLDDLRDGLRKRRRRTIGLDRHYCYHVHTLPDVCGAAAFCFGSKWPFVSQNWPHTAEKQSVRN